LRGDRQPSARLSRTNERPRSAHGTCLQAQVCKGSQQGVPFHWVARHCGLRVRVKLTPNPNPSPNLVLGVDCLDCVCVCSVWVPCVALPSGGGSSVGPSPLCGSPVWVPCAGPLCGSPVWVPSVWVPCVGPLCGPLVVLRPCGIYSRDVSRSFTRYRSDCTYIGHRLGRHCEGAIYQQLYSTGSWDSETFNTLSRLL